MVDLIMKKKKPSICAKSNSQISYSQHSMLLQKADLLETEFMWYKVCIFKNLDIPLLNNLLESSG